MSYLTLLRGLGGIRRRSMLFLLRPFVYIGLLYFFVLILCKVYVAYHLFFRYVFSYIFSRRDLVAFKDEFGDITVGHVGESFWAYGTLSTRLANIGVSMLAERFKGSQTMIVPYNLCVSVLANHTTRLHLICLILCLPFFQMSH